MSLGSTSSLGEGVRVFTGFFSVIPLAVGILILSAVWGAFDGDPAQQEMRVTINGQPGVVHPAPGMEGLVRKAFKDRGIPNSPDVSHELFGGMPLFAKLFFSLIASGFVLFGVTGIVMAAKGKPIQRPRGSHQSSRPSAPLASQGGYTCGKCGATLTAGVEVSPSGDVKCSYCNGWFNIHRS